MTLLSDPEPRVRRRAALAVGRVGLPEGVAPLAATLADVDPEVRQMGAFALGLIGDREAVPALVKALSDQAPIVCGRAAEALGLIGDPSPAAAIGRMAAEHGRLGGVATLAPDAEPWPLEPSVDAWRLGIGALVRLKAWEPLAGAVLDAAGQPITRWWPAAYALQRIEDRRAVPALLALVRGPGIYTRAFAARGLGTHKEPAALDVLRSLASDRQADPRVVVAAVRALAQMGDARGVPPLLDLLRAADPNVRLEAATALGALRAREAFDPLLDRLADRWPAMRAAALGAVARIDPEGFILVLSGLESDADWTVRAALAAILGELEPERALPRLRLMLEDTDRRVLPAALASLRKLGAPDAAAVLLEHLQANDPAVRAAAAREVGALKPEGGAAALAQAYRFGAGDPTYVARAAALAALAEYGAAAAAETLTAALADKAWAVRIRAADLLRGLAPGGGSAAIRPVPDAWPEAVYESPDVVAPDVSPHLYVETAKGTIQIELAVLDAPLAARSFVALARQGFFNGLTFHRVVPNFVIQGGDPRGDGEGGPDYTLRDELSQRPFLRGTVGIALDWRDTGGSQFFVTHSPQPHLDARYPVIGRVVAGMDVVDRIQQGDRIERVRVWDGTTFTSVEGAAVHKNGGDGRPR